MKTNSGIIRNNEIGAAIKRKRAALGMSLRDVEAECGVTPSTLSRFETGKAESATGETVAKICQWLGVPLESFTDDDSERIVIYPDQDTVSVVAQILARDSRLPESAKAGLVELFEAGYKLAKIRR